MFKKFLLTPFMFVLIGLSFFSFSAKAMNTTDQEDDNHQVVVQISPKPQLSEIDKATQNGISKKYSDDFENLSTSRCLPSYQDVCKYLIFGGISVGVVYIFFVNPILLNEVFHIDKIFKLNETTWHLHRP